MFAPLSDLNKTLGEKARWELDKDAACSFEQTLKAAPYKATIVKLHASHLPNHPSKISKMC